jgi:hypothetical protein
MRFRNSNRAAMSGTADDGQLAEVSAVEAFEW